MAIIKTTKHEMEYDSETKRAIFNGRNKTANVPTQDGFPQRLISPLAGSDIEDNALILGPTDEISGTTLEMSSGTIEEHSLIL